MSTLFNPPHSPKKTFKTHRLNGRTILCVAAVLVAGMLSSTQAAVLITSTAGAGGTATGGSGYTIGTRFVVGSSDLSVTDLGVWDQGSNGLLFAHQIGLWNSSGTLIASTTVGAGTSGTLLSEFRYATLGSPVTLVAGATYTLGALYSETNSDAYYAGAGFPTFDSAVSSTANGAKFGGPNISNLTFPSGSASGTAYVGPNMQFTLVPVPEPGTALLAGLGFCLILSSRRFARRQS